MPFLPPNQQRQSTEGIYAHHQITLKFGHNKDTSERENSKRREINSVMLQVTECNLGV